MQAVRSLIRVTIRVLPEEEPVLRRKGDESVTGEGHRGVADERNALAGCTAARGDWLEGASGVRG